MIIFGKTIVFLSFCLFVLLSFFIMKAFIISIGEEMLIGQTVNTNAAWMASALNDIGVEVEEIRVITDDREAIHRTLQYGAENCSLVLITGGLGPTRDDVTRDVLCRFFDSELVMNQQVLDDITGYLKDRGRKVSDLNRDQAMVPDKADIIRNPFGTAPGFWFSAGQTHCIAMPGVPYEMKEMMSKHVLPALEEMGREQYILHKTVLTHGIGESDLARELSDWEDSLPGDIQLAYLPSTGIVKLRLTAKGKSMERLEQMVEREVDKLRKLIPEYIWGYDDDSLEAVIGELLKAQNATLSTAESCTGGYLAHRITGVPGSSAYYAGSVVAYADQVKEELLHVDRELLRAHGAVSREVSESMAQGIREKLKTTYGIGVTGIAGPGGGTDDKPVGTVWIAIAGPDGKVTSKKHQFGDKRARNTIRAGNAALAMLRLVLVDKREKEVRSKKEADRMQ